MREKIVSAGMNRAVDIGYKGTGYYIWQACSVCGQERWVYLKLGKPISFKCLKHNGEYQGVAEQNTNWKGDTAKQQTGRMRALRWYPKEPCEVCGKVAERHHKDGNALNNEPNNITFLCRKHHMEADGRLTRRRVLN